MADLCDQPQATQQSVLNKTGKDKFLLVLNLPEVLRKQKFYDKLINIDPLQISIFGTVVPTITIPSIETRFGGQSLNVTSFSRPDYEPLRVNFVVDNKFHNYWVLWKWLSILNDPLESYYTGTDPKLETYKDRLATGIVTEYQANFSVLGLNEYNQHNIEFIYHNAFITSLGGITYSYRDPEILESTVEFKFSQLEVNLPN